MPTSRDFKVVLTLDDRVSQGLDKIKDSVKSAEEKFKTLAVTGGAVFGATSLLVGKSVQEFAAFDKSIQRAGANVNATAETLQNFRNVAIDAAQGTAFSSQEAADALFFLAGGSISADEAMESLRETIQFATANTLDLRQSTVIASQAISLFKLEGEELGKVLDVLTKAGQISFATAEQLADSFSEAAPIAAQLGVDIIDLTSVIGALGDVGLFGSEAGVALKRALTELINPSKQAQEGLAALGISTQEVSKLLNDPIALLKLFEERMNGIHDPVQRATALSQIFGQISGPAMAALLNLGTASIEDYRTELQAANGTLEDTFNRVNSAQSPLEELMSDFEDFRLVLGQAVTPAIRELMAIVTPWLEKMREWVEAHPKLTVQIIAVVAGLSGLLLAIGAVGLAIPAILTGLSVLTTAFGLLMTSITLVLSPLGLLLLAISAIVAVFVFWDEIIDYVSDQMLLFADTVSNAWDRTKAATIAIWNAIKAYLFELFQGLLDKFTGVYDAITSKVRGIIDSVGAAINRVRELSSAAAGKVAGAIPFFAHGGVVTKPTLAVVGEAGPERIEPIGRGGSSSGSITIHINNPTVRNDSDIAAIRDEILSALSRMQELAQMGALA
jgi:TP901 family phage tail tape measure protein